jgi:hypothetical protein
LTFALLKYTAECSLTTPDKLKGWRSKSTRTEGLKLSLMIDDQARHGDRPEYSKGDLAFPVGLATWAIDRKDWPAKGEDKESPMLMRPIWRDNTSPLWGEWKDPDGIQCELLSMYFITEHGFSGLTQARPHYKFNHPPPPVKINLGIGGTSVSSKRVVHQMKARAVDQATPTTDATADDDEKPPTQPVEPAEPNDVDPDVFEGETLKELEKEMDEAPSGEPAKVDSTVVTDESGAELKL